MTTRTRASVAAIAVFVAIACLQLTAGTRGSQTAADQAPRSDWIQLFNGKNLDGWVPKIAGENLGVNYNDTFRVVNGLLTVSYDKYKTFDNRFGHLFYNRRKFSYYVIAAEYRFVGEQ